MSDEREGRDWEGVVWRIAEGGLPWVICGYILLPPEHPWRMREDGSDRLAGDSMLTYDDLPGEASEDAPSEVNYADPEGWIGFDTGHWNDHWSREALAEAGVSIPEELEQSAAFFVDKPPSSHPWDYRREWSLPLLEDFMRRWAAAAAAPLMLPAVMADIDRTTRGETE
jgi:hypothetical protein